MRQLKTASVGAAEIASRLVSARQARSALDAFPGQLPEALAEAYAIQDVAISLWDDVIIGWKVGLVPPALQLRLGSGRVAGPIFSRNLRWAEGGARVDFPVYVRGFAAVEAEFIFVLGADAPSGKTSWTVEEAAEIVGDVRIGVETAGSPMPMINVLGPTAVASDFGNNFGVILGERLSGWREKMATMTATTRIDGFVVGEGRGDVLPDGPLGGLAFLLGHLAERGLPASAGLLISSGAVTGVHDILPGQSASIEFTGLGRIDCRAVPA